MSEDPFASLRACLADIEEFGSADQVGRAFGPGDGLEEVSSRIRQHLPDIDSIRRFDWSLMLELLTQIPGSDPERRILEVMGVVGDEGAGVSSPSRELAGAAVALIPQVHEPGSLLALWEERDDVATELFAWHCVARLRLAATGDLPIA